VLCGNEFPGNLELCPDDGTLLTPIGKEPRVGDIIADRYEIMGILGDGGMGKVYKARHNLMKRVVAIKMLLPHLVQSGPALKRFQQEAQAASALKHPHIMTVHDFGISDKGMPFLVMDYLEGVSLSSLLQELGALPQDRSVNIFIQACSALSHAHKNGVVHRDLKPANLMLIDFDGQPDFLMVVDFGIAKLLQPDGAAEQLTHTGEVFGSPLYMSPEQCRGKELDPRSDIYSLGCVLYRTVTGRPVFAGRDAMECMFKQVNDLPSRFGDVCPEFGLSDKLETAVFKAIAKDPEDRYQTMAEFRDALEAIKGPATPVNRVFSVPPQSGQEVAYDLATDRLRRAPTHLASTQMAGPHGVDPASGVHVPHMGVAGDNTGVWSDSNRSASAPGSNAQAPSAVPGGSADSGSNPSGGFVGEPGSASSRPIEPGRSTGSSINLAGNTIAPAGQPVSKLQPPAEATPSSELSSGRAGVSNQGDAFLRENSLGRVTNSKIPGPSNTQQSSDQEPAAGRRTGSYASKYAESQKVRAAAARGGNNKTVFIGIGVTLVLVVGGIGVVSMMSSSNKNEPNHGGAGKSGNTTMSNSSGGDSGGASGSGGAPLNEAKSLIASGNYQNAEKTLTQAVGTAGSDKVLAEVLPLQARVLAQSGKYAQAQDAWTKLLGIQKKSGASQPDMARTKSLLAVSMLEQGNVDAAEPLLNEAEKTLSSAPEEQKEGLAHVYYGLSKVALAKGDYNKATDRLEAAISRLTSVEGADDPELLEFWKYLAYVYLLQGKYDDSKTTLEKMLAMAEEKFGKDSAQSADAYRDMGTVYFKKKQLSKAEGFYKKSLAIKTKDFGTDSVAAAEVMASLAMLYTAEHKFKLAEPLFKSALDIRTKEFGADSSSAKRTRENFAILQKLMKGSK